MYNFSDNLYILWISFIKTIIIIGEAFLLSKLIVYNHSLGIAIADALKISHNLALTVTSLGFVNNVTIVFTVFELIAISIIFYKLYQFKIFNNLFNKFVSFMKKC